MRLIDADQFGVISFQGKSEDFAEGVAFILEKIDEAPTIEERPRGEWLKGRWESCGALTEDYYNCSECGRETTWRTNYCSKCGADMRKEGYMK